MNTVVRATAGAGKTTGLLEAVYNSYKEAVSETGRAPKILLSTFTIKAANELSERLAKKAIELEDHKFLDFVSSGFLEVGTLHSIFFKILDKINDASDLDDQKYISQSKRRLIGRGYLHRVIKNQGMELEFSTAKDEKDLLEAFWYMQSSSVKRAVSIDPNKIFKSLSESLRDLIQGSSDEAMLLAYKNLSEKNWFSFEEIAGYINGKIEESSKNKKVYKNILKFVNEPQNSKDFVENQIKKDKIYCNLYSEWRDLFEGFLDEQSLYDISDIETRLLKELKNNKFDKKLWDYCFFDEYQDTSPIQKEIISILAGQSTRYFVGDPYQSIYFFRGAKKEIFLDEFADVEKDGGIVEYRLNNYRSLPKIVNFANSITKYMMPDFIPMDPFLEEQDSEIEVVHFKEGGVRDEVMYVSQKIKGIDLSKESVVVLARNKKDLLACGQKLKDSGVDFKYALSQGFEASLETLELISLLRFVLNPHDDINLLILLKSYWVDFSDLKIKNSLLKIKDESDSSLWDLVQSEAEASTLQEFLRTAKETSFSYALVSFITESEFLNYTDSLDASGEREKNIFKFISALEAEEDKPQFNVMSFCDDISNGYYRFESEDYGSEKGCILMTIHGSKGLQFDNVFIIGANKTPRSTSKPFYFDSQTGVFSMKSFVEETSKNQHLKLVEELVEKNVNEVVGEGHRLFYVAITRAKKNLYIMGSKPITKVSKNPTWMKRLLELLEREPGLASFLNLEACSEEGAVRVETLYLDKGFFLNTESLVFKEKDKIGVTQALGVENNDLVQNKDLVKFADSISSGVLFHELMEKTKSKEGAIERIPLHFKDDFETHKKAVEFLFSQSDFPFEVCVQKGEKEWGFDKIGEFKQSGKIDLWCRIDDEVWIVDYKTGSLLSSEKGFEQLQAYKDVLLGYLGDESLKFNLVLAFPYKNKILKRLNV